MQVDNNLLAKRCSTVPEAIEILKTVIHRQKGGDENYFQGEQSRYLRTVQRIASISGTPCRVLDIGSHYLHQAALLRLLGYEVSGLDVPAFSEAKFIRERSEMFGIRNHAIASLEQGEFLIGQENTFDLAIFTATLEHITFNPVRFWKRVYDLLKEDGTIYLTTPNALRAVALFRSARRLVALSGIGITVDEILRTVTYGHHWKEYSAWEIRRYFRALSPDFQVEIKWLGELPDHPLKRRIMQIVHVFPPLRSEIEAVVRVPKKTQQFAAPPVLPMTLRQA